MISAGKKARRGDGLFRQRCRSGGGYQRDQDRRRDRSGYTQEKETAQTEDNEAAAQTDGITSGRAGASEEKTHEDSRG